MEYLPDKNLDYPVFIDLGQGGTASGFFANNEESVFLVTARHVLIDDNGNLLGEKATLTSWSNRFVNKLVMEVDLERVRATGSLAVHKDADVAIINMATAIDGKLGEGGKTKALEGVVIQSKDEGSYLIGVGVKTFVKFDQVRIGNSAVVFGYPNSIGDQGQLEREVPLVRRGAIRGYQSSQPNHRSGCAYLSGQQRWAGAPS